MNKKYFYQVFWSDGYETVEANKLLSHNQNFTKEEFDNLVHKAVSVVGFSTFLADIETYLINEFGFEYVDIICCNTD